MRRRLAIFAWFTVAYNLLVIMWGAFVRATGSGAGCGRHWPLCNGEVIPRAEQIETLIEFAHRITSAASGILAIGLVFWAVRAYERGHIVRRGAYASLGFVILEGILGAGLVLFELVTDNSSVARAVAMAIHLVNTLLLIGAMTLTAWWASGGRSIRLRDQGTVGKLLLTAIIGMLLLGASGAITALGDTLFPARSFSEGLAQDFNPTAHFLIQLRVWHPAFAIGLGVYIVAMAQWVARKRPSPACNIASAILIVLFGLQIGIGALNVALLVPVSMQLIHLLMADLVWIALVVLSAAALTTPAQETVARPVYAA
ncbi:MAG: heme A synthase [Oscillochloris sp.]|nr:heme A synthase [Oscillochloris sp.]